MAIVDNRDKNREKPVAGRVAGKPYRNAKKQIESPNTSWKTLPISSIPENAYRASDITVKQLLDLQTPECRAKARTVSVKHTRFDKDLHGGTLYFDVWNSDPSNPPPKPSIYEVKISGYNEAALHPKHIKFGLKTSCQCGDQKFRRDWSGWRNGITFRENSINRPPAITNPEWQQKTGSGGLSVCKHVYACLSFLNRRKNVLV